MQQAFDDEGSPLSDETLSMGDNMLSPPLSDNETGLNNNDIRVVNTFVKMETIWEEDEYNADVEDNGS